MCKLLKNVTFGSYTTCSQNFAGLWQYHWKVKYPEFLLYSLVSRGFVRECTDDEFLDCCRVTDLKELLKKGESSKNYEFKTNLNDFKFPIKKGDNVGTLDVIDNGKVIKKVDLTVGEDIDKLNILSLYGKYLKGIVSGFN